MKVEFMKGVIWGDEFKNSDFYKTYKSSQPFIGNKCSDRSMEVKYQALLGNYERQSDQPTNQPNRTTNLPTDDG